MNSEQKTQHANESGKALKHPLVVEVIDELIENLGVSKTGLEKYGITKVAMYAAQVARAQALGIDPDSLRTTDAEDDAHARGMIEMMQRNGIPVTVIANHTPKEPPHV